MWLPGMQGSHSQNGHTHQSQKDVNKEELLALQKAV